jgi:Ca2+-binding RTX toxin-like protein
MAHPNFGYTWRSGHYYNVGASYAWWDGAARRWIIDDNWIPNSVQGAGPGYQRMGPGALGHVGDYLCSLDPARFLTGITVPPVPTAGAPTPIDTATDSLTRTAAALDTSARPQMIGALRSGRCLGHAATIVGTSHSDQIVGTKHDDVIAAGGGDDLILGGGGHDVICGQAGADRVLGQKGADVISGGEGNDTVIAGDGNDSVNGGIGVDIIEGSRGADTLFGGNDDALDIVAFLYASDGVHVDFNAGTASGAGHDRFHGFDAVVGSMFDDELIGTRDEQWFVPLDGDDLVDGRTGSDVVDFLLADQGLDVDLSVGTATGQGLDVVNDIEVVFGTNFQDHLVGSSNYEYLAGAGGNDYLNGVDGDDTLDGGDGEDTCDNASYYSDCANHEDGGTGPPDSSEPIDPT